MELSGKIKKIFDAENISANFTKRELVLTTDDKYPQYVLIQFVNDQIDYLHGLQPGDEVKISINIRGREWINPEGVAKYFNTIQGWKIEIIERVSDSVASPRLEEYSSAPAKEEEEYDDLPF